MTIAPLRTASLALSAGALALAGPASAVATPHAAAGAGSAPVYGELSVHDGLERAHHRGWHKRGKDRDQYRYRGAPQYQNYSAYQPRGYYDDNRARYAEPVYDNTRVWRGDDGRVYCRKSDGTTGLIIGGAAGALLGRELAGRGGDRTLGAILGAAGGALLGKSIDSKTRCN